MGGGRRLSKGGGFCSLWWQSGVGIALPTSVYGFQAAGGFPTGVLPRLPAKG